MNEVLVGEISECTEFLSPNKSTIYSKRIETASNCLLSWIKATKRLISLVHWNKSSQLEYSEGLNMHSFPKD